MTDKLRTSGQGNSLHWRHQTCSIQFKPCCISTHVSRTLEHCTFLGHKNFARLPQLGKKTQFGNKCMCIGVQRLFELWLLLYRAGKATLLGKGFCIFLVYNFCSSVRPCRKLPNPVACAFLWNIWIHILFSSYNFFRTWFKTEWIKT